jgi:hypothetical protein
MARRENKGAAVSTTLSAGIDAAVTALSIASNSGWPTGGANGNFFATIDPETPNEERVLIGAQSGGSCTSVVRGQDNTTAKTHAAGAVIIHSSAAVDYDEANRHINVTTDDNHTQYMKTDGTRHDLTARHSAGTVVPTAIPVAVGTALAEGAGTTLARASHVHVLGAGSINNSNMFAAGIVDANAIGALQVGSSELAAASVIAGKIGAAAIDDHSLFAADTQPWIVQATNPGAVGAGRIWLNTTKDTLLVRNAANTQWKCVINFGVSVAYTPAVQGITLGTSLNYARYTRLGRYILINGFLKFQSGAVVTGNMAVGVPPTVVGADHRGTYADEFFSHGAGRASIAGLGYAAVSVLGHGTTTYTPSFLGFFATAGYAAWNPTTPASWNIGDRFSWFAEIECESAEDANFV